MAEWGFYGRRRERAELAQVLEPRGSAGPCRFGGPEIGSQVGGCLKTLEERYEMVEKRLPVFAKPKARKGHYTIRDNFLRSWLDALAVPTAAINFRPRCAGSSSSTVSIASQAKAISA
jgi:hypothetical protein